MPSLPQLRKQIDRIDDQLVKLLNQRLACAHRIGEEKARLGAKIYSPAREKEVLRRLCERKGRFLTERELRSIYQRILPVSRNHQAKVFRKVAKKK